eukprot:Skav219066  [mRNA]  locus=scaffold1033:122380:123107:- [translate_table: standard]
MANCPCCNNLGSSPKFQLLLSIAILLLVIPLGIWGITVLIAVSIENSAPSYYDDYDAYWAYHEQHQGFYDFYNTALSLAYWSGAIVSLLWLLALCSRCCAPCCCQLSDVECPCGRPCCQMWHLLDVPFFLGVMIALWPINIFYQLLNSHEFFMWEFMTQAERGQGSYRFST